MSAPCYTLTYRCKSAGPEALWVTEGGYSATDALLIVRSLLSTGFCDSVFVEVEK